MRLTSELVQQSPAVLNCLGDRTLVLRNLSIPAIENLATARDGFDTLDLSNNAITTVGDTFPPFPRLTTLHLGGNRIARITGGLAQSLPNLRTLVLTGNRIATLADLNLPELARMPHLRELCVGGNAVARAPGLRARVAELVPQLELLDFARVRAREGQRKRKRAAAAAEAAPPRKRARDGRATTAAAKARARVAALAPELRRGVREAVEKARSVEEVARIQKLVRDGDVAALLAQQR